MRSNLDDNKAQGLCIGPGLRFATMNWVPANNAPITDQFPPMILLNPAGAVNVFLPDSSPARKGLAYLLVNVSAFTVTCQTTAGAAFTTAIALTTNQSCWVVCTGDPSLPLGWRKIPATAA